MSLQKVGRELWEPIDESSFRLKVPGGWIVKSVAMGSSFGGHISVAIHQVFISDANHEWILPL